MDTQDTQQTPGPEEEKDPPNIQPDDLTLSAHAAQISEPQQASSAQSAQQESGEWEYIIEEDDDQGESGISTPFDTEIQRSSAMPVLQTEQDAVEKDAALGQSAPAVATKKTAGARPRLLRIAMIAALVVAAMGFLWITVFAQPAQPLTTVPRGVVTTVPMPQPPVVVKKTPMPIAPPKTTGNTSGITGTTQGNMQGGGWVPQQLPAGWVGAGLSNGDALFAERTAWTFTDREEGLDFRNVGTRALHGGTLTAATFILSPGGKTRFAQNDVRVINNTLFDHVQNVQLVQAAVNAVPRLTGFQMQGQNQFAWVDVSFQLYQSQIDPATHQRTEGLEKDPATNQPRTHHMSVLLVRIDPATQGSASPMGGSGWLVSSYGLDMTSPLTITQPI